METRGALLWEPGTNSGWSVESIQIDPPKEREVLVKLAASGGCHSDQHLDDGVIPLPWAPVLGGHEGAGVVTEIGPGVTDVAVGDHVVLSFLPSCTVVVVGFDGVGINAVQGTRHKGARHIIAVDPVPFKQDVAHKSSHSSYALARSLSSHLRGVKRDPPHPYHQGC